MKWTQHSETFFELRDERDCLRGYVDMGEACPEIAWYEFGRCKSNGSLGIRLGLAEAQELLLSIVEDRPARLVVQVDPYDNLVFRAGDRFIDAGGAIWVCDDDGEVYPEGSRHSRWTVREMRECDAADRSWWPLRKIT